MYVAPAPPGPQIGSPLFCGLRNWNATKALLGLSPLLGKFSPVLVPLASVTVTVVEAFRVPPSPVQASVNVLLAAVSAPVLAEPLVARLPDHAPEAVQLVALVDDHVSELLPPLVTLVGFAVKVTVGAGAELVTVTFTDLLAVPPSPLQLSVNVLLAAVSAPVLAEPLVARLPDHAPEAVQLVALVDDHVSELLPPLATLVGFAVKDTVGAGAGLATVTITDLFAVPPLPVQVSVNVLLAAVSAPVLEEPLVARLPDHAPEAVQLVALVDDQVRVEDSPLATLVGFAVSVTVGAGEVVVTVTDRLVVPPLPVHDNVNVVFAVSAEVAWLPLVAFEPLQPPEAVQLVALLVDHVRVDDPPLTTEAGLAVSVTVGALDATVTLAVRLALPPAPVQVRVKLVVAVSAPVDLTSARCLRTAPAARGSATRRIAGTPVECR